VQIAARVKREQRLRAPADFQRVRAVRRSWAHPLLVCYVAPNETGRTRVGITVGKRVAKQAVIRNRIRRRVAEAVRPHYSELTPGFDVLFIARGPAATATWTELRGAAEQLLRRARLLPPAPAA
jgi:ribonuclease P protein component